MRRIVLAMMTTLNGRLDDPDAWVTGISEDHYEEIDRGYAGFDTILVGRTTAAEMIDYWPGARAAPAAAGAHRRMAERMHTYRKYVVTTDPGLTLAWHNAEPVTAPDDAALRTFVADLKDRPGADIHLSGGARLAQSFVRLGLIDEFRFSVFPVHSPGATWFDGLDGPLNLELIGSRSFENGAVALHYRPGTAPA